MSDEERDIRELLHREADLAPRPSGLGRAVAQRARRQRTGLTATSLLGVAVLIVMGAYAFSKFGVHQGSVRPVIPGPTESNSPLPERSPFRRLQPGWNELAAPPGSGTHDVVVWAPSSGELVLWGGSTGSGEAMPVEGLSWAEATDSWSPMAAAPIAPRAGAGSVFTGREVIVWGGYGTGQVTYGDGAAYDPAADSWRELPPAPIDAAIPEAAVWSGEEAIFWGSTDREQNSREGAAYNPKTNDWRLLPDAPLVVDEGTAIWTGDEMIVFGADLDHNNRTDEPHAYGIAYSPATNSWRSLPDVELSPQASAIAWTGEHVIAWDYELSAASYDPAADAWQRLPKLPIDFAECYPTTEFVGSYVFAWFCGDAAIWDVRTDTWTRIHVPGQIPPHSVVAGEVLLFAGDTQEPGQNALWAYVPPPDDPDRVGQLTRSPRAVVYGNPLLSMGMFGQGQGPGAEEL